ncbi:MAG: hypothetical protein WBO10_09830 [Pyrinomonadaceae bacterium]
MAAKIIALIVTLVASLAAGVFVFLGILVAMNGYSESDASYGLIAYVALALLVSLLMGISAFLLTGRLIKSEFGPATAVLIASVAFSLLGATLKGVCGLVGIGVAEFVRVNF